MNERALGEIAPPSASGLSDIRTAADGITITCTERLLPPSLDAELRALYANIHSTLDQLRIYGGLDQITHVYAARSDERAVALLLLQHQGRCIRVINEGMGLDARELRRFADYAFARWPQVRRLVFHAVHVPGEKLHIGRPLQHYPCTADLTMPLPASVHDYLARLGRNMRRNLRRYHSRLQQRFPDLQIRFLDGATASEAELRAIVELNRARIASKQIDYTLDAEVEQVIALARTCGTTCVMTAEGRIIAGGTGYQVGASFFYKINAHDPATDAYSTGILCCYLMICESIARGCTEFNFMWNTYPYKIALGGRPRRLDRVLVYRDAAALLAETPTAAGAAASAVRHHLNSLPERAAAADIGEPPALSLRDRLLLKAVETLRTLKHRLRGIRAE